MSADILEFPNFEPSKDIKPFMAMTMTRVINGKTVIMNIAKMSKEEFLAALISDAKMREKEELVLKYINN